MRIGSLYNKKFTLSFEIFPPKTSEGENSLYGELDLLAKYSPDFVSVTYGAGGSTRDKTLEIALKIKDRYSITPLVHFTCVGSSKEEIKQYINTVKNNGINSILALRGDPPKGEVDFKPHPDGFSYANELILYIKSLGDFSIGVAGYPETHAQAIDSKTDLDNLKRKVDSGAEFAITQLFYDNDKFYEFYDNCIKIGIDIPIVPGIMPVTSANQILKSISLSNSAIPKSLKNIIEKNYDDESFIKYGLDFSTEQCAQLKKFGAAGLHLYTINKSKPVIEIMNHLEFGANTK
jgi:methylenetetrahydrofolate reductase (NADPH)